MIPKRFVAEYPERCLALLERLAPDANDMGLVGTFAIMLASSMLTIPFERLRAGHPMFDGHDELAEALRGLSKSRWVDVDWLAAASPGQWRFARIMGDPNHVGEWHDEHGRPALSGKANTIERRSVGEVLRLLRNALAHGNIVYLNREGREMPGTRVEFLGFLSRYEETQEQRDAAETYRLLVARETDFLEFVRLWARWIGAHGDDSDIIAR